MISAHLKRVEKAITDMIEDVYKTHLRKMQSDMHLCAAGCCDNYQSRPTMDNVQNCVENCASPLLMAHNHMQHELEQFQARLQSCLLKCNDDVGPISNNNQITDISKYRQQFEICSGRCVDKHIQLIPKMMSTMKSVLAKGPNTMD